VSLFHELSLGIIEAKQRAEQDLGGFEFVQSHFILPHLHRSNHFAILVPAAHHVKDAIPRKVSNDVRRMGGGQQLNVGENFADPVEQDALPLRMHVGVDLVNQDEKAPPSGAVAPVLGYGIYFGLLSWSIWFMQKKEKGRRKICGASSAINVLRRTRRNL
jgi:hypothetical protein